MALSRLRSPAGQDERCAVSEAGGSSCPSLAHSAHVAPAGGGHRGQRPQHCWGKCPLDRTVQAGSGRMQQGLAGSSRVWQAGGQAGSPAHSRRKVVSLASCGSAGLVSPAEQPLSLTAKPVCEY